MHKKVAQKYWRKVYASRTLYFHGTSSAFLDEIRSKGLVPNPGQLLWEGNLTGSDRHIYLTSRLSLALRYAKQAVRKFGGDPIIITVQLSEDDPRLATDEDILKSVSTDTLYLQVHELDKKTVKKGLTNLWRLAQGRPPLGEEKYSHKHAGMVMNMTMALGLLPFKGLIQEAAKENISPAYDPEYFSFEDRKRIVEKRSSDLREDIVKELNKAALNPNNPPKPERIIEYLSSDVPKMLSEAPQKYGGNRLKFFRDRGPELARKWPEWFGPLAGIKSDRLPTIAVEARSLRPESIYVLPEGVGLVSGISDLKSKAKKVY